MRIAIVTAGFPGLSNTFILNLITGLIDAGADVDIFSFGLKFDAERTHPDVLAYDLMKRTCSLPDFPGTRSGAVVALAGEVLRHGYRNPSTVARLLNPGAYGRGESAMLSAYYQLQLADRAPYDVVHCQFGTLANRVIDMGQGPFFTGSLVTSFRGFDISRRAYTKDRHTYAQLFRKGDLFLPTCNMFRDRLIELGCPPAKIRVYASSIKCDRFPFRARTLPDTGPLRLVTVGRLVEKKGIEYAIRAVAAFARQYPHLEYHIAGDGPLREPLAKLVAELEMERHIIFAGDVVQDEVIRLLDQSHIFLLPNITASDGNQEGQTNAVKEAMAMGLMTIAGDSGGNPELVDHDRTGWLVPEKDVAAIVERLENIIPRHAEWPDIGRAARLHIETHYDAAPQAAKLLQLYEETLTLRR